MWLTTNTVPSQSDVRSFAGHDAVKEETMISSEPTTDATARALPKARLGATRTPASPALRRVAGLAAVLMLMTVESVAARQPHATRMMEQADARAHPSAHRSQRKMAGPLHAQSRKHAARVRAGSPQTNAARNYDRPGSYFLHGTRF
jgi:hypothetical protein